MAAANQIHNSTVLRDLQPGDLIQFDRRWYCHWGVYKGDEKIIHLTGDDVDVISGNSDFRYYFSIYGKRYNKAFVRIADFWDVVLNGKAYKNNDRDITSSPAAGDVILRRALDKLGEIRYNILWHNCEHFATYCRYGVGTSAQVQNALEWAGMAAVFAIVLFFIFRSSDSSRSRRSRQSASE